MSDQLIIPEGKRTGCLARKSQFGNVSKVFAESDIPLIPRDQWAALLPTITLRPQVQKIKDQNGYGSCATESTTQAVEIIAAQRGEPWIELNPLFIYHETSGGSDGGSSIDENLVFARDKGIAPESVWPRSKGFRATPTAEAIAAALKHRIVEFFDIENVDEFGSALLAGFPVVFGYSGHSICAVSLKSPTQIEYANSWGDWGDAGFGVLSFSSIVWGYGAFAVRTTTPR